jgi:ABC-type nitrate/sulfonate/bicarbonate transport system ATPase subunit/ABC-type nitrate/sulfonate/bicarbonate transport system permease component
MSLASGVGLPGTAQSPHGRRLLTVAGIVLLFALWALASLASRSFVPGPWTTLADAASLLARRGTWRQVGITMMRVCLGFAAGYAVGAATGILVGARRGADALLKPIVLFFQGMPPLLWAIPIVVALGIGHLPTILVIALITFPLVTVTVGEGMRTLPRELGEMLSLFAPGPRARLAELVLPHLRPFLGAALKSSLVLAVKASVTAEYFGANDGIGFQIQAAYQTLQVRRLFAWALVLILVILVFNHVLPRLGRLASRLARAAGHGAEVSCRLEDIRELKSIFLAKHAGHRVALGDVAFAYGRDEAVIASSSLAVDEREIAVITGDSGIGKTTLLKLAAGLLHPAAGRVDRPRRIGFVFQDDRLLPWRSVAENTALPLFYAGTPRRNSLCFAQFLLAEAGLAGHENKLPGELSGGMKRRAALARCFARIPDAIFLDEPFAGLHREARIALWQMFLRLHSLHPVPVVVVTHYPEEIAGHRSCRLYTLVGKPAVLREMPGAAGKTVRAKRTGRKERARAGEAASRRKPR